MIIDLFDSFFAILEVNVIIITGCSIRDIFCLTVKKTILSNNIEIFSLMSLIPGVHSILLFNEASFSRWPGN